MKRTRETGVATIAVDAVSVVLDGRPVLREVTASLTAPDDRGDRLRNGSGKSPRSPGC